MVLPGKALPISLLVIALLLAGCTATQEPAVSEPIVTLSVTAVASMTSTPKPDPTSTTTAELQTLQLTPASDALYSPPQTETAVPQTDFDMIIGQVTELTDRYALNFLSQPGWTHLQYQSFVPVSTKGNGLETYGIAATQLFPGDVTIEDYWFNENDTGYDQEIHHVSDTAGNLLQRVAITNREMVNLTLKALGAPTHHYRSPSGEVPNPVSAIQDRITYVLREMSQSAEASAWLEGDQYTIIVIDQFSEPLQLDNASEPYIAHRYQVILNWETGAIQYEEFAFQTPDKTWLIMDSRTDFFIEVLEELPATAAQTLEEGIALIEEEN